MEERVETESIWRRSPTEPLSVWLFTATPIYKLAKLHALSDPHSFLFFSLLPCKLWQIHRLFSFLSYVHVNFSLHSLLDTFLLDFLVPCHNCSTLKFLSLRAFHCWLTPIWHTCSRTQCRWLNVACQHKQNVVFLCSTSSDFCPSTK